MNFFGETENKPLPQQYRSVQPLFFRNGGGLSSIKRYIFCYTKINQKKVPKTLAKQYQKSYRPWSTER